VKSNGTDDKTSPKESSAEEKAEKRDIKKGRTPSFWGKGVEKGDHYYGVMRKKRGEGGTRPVGRKGEEANQEIKGERILVSRRR